MTFSSSSRDEVEVRLGVVDQVVEQAHGQLAGGEADVFLLVLEDDVVDAALAGAARLAAGDLGAGQVLQLQRDVLEDVPHPGALAHAAAGTRPACRASSRGRRGDGSSSVRCS